jgi:hypothetical protein
MRRLQFPFLLSCHATRFQFQRPARSLFDSPTLFESIGGGLWRPEVCRAARRPASGDGADDRRTATPKPQSPRSIRGGRSAPRSRFRSAFIERLSLHNRKCYWLGCQMVSGATWICFVRL